MKHFLNITIFLGLLGFILPGICFSNVTPSKPIVGYGSSDAVLPAKNQELFYMGFKLGFEKTVKNKELKNSLTTKQISDGTQLGAIKSASQLIDEGVKVIVGFPTSHEALLVGKYIKDAGILTIFSGAGHSDLATFGPNVFTTGESMTYGVGKMLEFINKTYNKKKGIVITNPFAVFSKNLSDTILNNKSIMSLNIDLTLMNTDQSLKLTDADVQKLKMGRYDYILMTAYADESVKVLEQLENNHLDIPIIANSAWTTGDVDFIRRFLTNRQSAAYVVTIWFAGSDQSKPFEEAVKKQYGRVATSEIAYGYDLGVIIGKTLNSVGPNATKFEIAEAFRKIRCFDGLSSGTMCFPLKGGHVERTIGFVKFTKDGFKPIVLGAGK